MAAAQKEGGIGKSAVVVPPCEKCANYMTPCHAQCAFCGNLWCHACAGLDRHGRTADEFAVLYIVCVPCKVARIVSEEE